MSWKQQTHLPNAPVKHPPALPLHHLLGSRPDARQIKSGIAVIDIPLHIADICSCKKPWKQLTACKQSKH